MDQPWNIVVGVDASAEAEVALEVAIRLGTGLRGRLVVVHAVGLLEEGGYRQRPDLGAIVERCRARIDGAADLPIDIVLEDGPAAEVVVRQSATANATMVVVGSRGHGQAQRPLGSVSEAVLAASEIPVVVVPAATLS